MANAAKDPMDFDFGDDLSSSSAPQATTPEEIRANAHIANGGEAEFPCPKCRGTGTFRGYARTFSCFKCEGSGKVTQRVAAAANGKQTRAENIAAWQAEHAELIEAVRKLSSWHRFCASLIADLDTYGTWSENKIASARSVLAQAAAKREELNAERAKATGALSGTVGVERINRLFETALESGLKRPIFRTENLVIKPAKRHAGVLYVTDRRVEDRERGGAAYVGKIVAGKFEARREALPDTLTLLCEIAGDPMEAAVKYGRSTGSCGMCGRELTDPQSVAAGIGPICASNWGI